MVRDGCLTIGIFHGHSCDSGVFLQFSKSEVSKGPLTGPRMFFVLVICSNIGIYKVLLLPSKSAVSYQAAFLLLILVNLLLSLAIMEVLVGVGVLQNIGNKWVNLLNGYINYG